MFVRTTKFNGVNPDQVRGTLDEIADRLLPELEREWGLLDGFVLVNHGAGKVMGVTLWDTELAMRAAAEGERRDRDELAIDWRTEPIVETWEVALSHKDLIERGREAVAEEALAHSRH
jgi:hypothetical protein